MGIDSINYSYLQLVDWYKLNSELIKERNEFFIFFKNMEDSKVDYKKLTNSLNKLLIHYDNSNINIDTMDAHSNQLLNPDLLSNKFQDYLILPDIYYLRIYKSIYLYNRELLDSVIELFTILSTQQALFYQYECLQIFNNDLEGSYNIDNINFYYFVSDYILNHSDYIRSDKYKDYLLTLYSYVVSNTPIHIFHVICSRNIYWEDYQRIVEEVNTLEKFIHVVLNLILPMVNTINESSYYIIDIKNQIYMAQLNLKTINDIYNKLNPLIKFELPVLLSISSTLKMMYLFISIEDQTTFIVKYANKIRKLHENRVEIYNLLNELNNKNK